MPVWRHARRYHHPIGRHEAPAPFVVDIPARLHLGNALPVPAPVLVHHCGIHLPVHLPASPRHPVVAVPARRIGPFPYLPYAARPVVGRHGQVAVAFHQPFAHLLAVGECGQQRRRSHVVDLTYQRNVPAPEIPAAHVHEEPVGLHEVGPAVADAPLAAIPLLVHAHPRYQKFLHGAGIHLAKPVQLRVVAQQLLHRRRLHRFRPVAGRAHRLHIPIAEHAQHIAHQAPYQIVFQRRAPLVAHLRLLAHQAAGRLHHVAPLVAVSEPFAPVAVLPVPVHRIPAALCPVQQVVGHERLFVP